MKISFKLRVIVLTILVSMTVASMQLLIVRDKIIRAYVKDLNVHLCIESRRLSAFGKPEQMDRFLAGMTARLKLDSLNQLAVIYSAREESDSWSTDYLPRSLGQLEKLDWVQPDGEMVAGDRTRLDQADGEAKKCEISEFETDNSKWHGGRTLGANGDVYIVANLEPAEADINKNYIIPSAFLLLTGSVMLSLLGGWVISKYSLYPLERIRSAMQKLDNKNSNLKISENGKVPEHEDLYKVFNSMVEKIESNYLQAIRFSSDAAHELKTPLTILRGRIEMEFEGSTVEREIKFSNDLQLQINKLISITSKLLLLSKLDSGHVKTEFEKINFSEFLKEIVDEIISCNTRVKSESFIESGLELYCDRVLLSTAISNILLNAFFYCRDGGSVSISSTISDGGIKVMVRNDSKVLSAEDRSQIFNRFFRGSEERGSEFGSSGLGLNLAQEITKFHGGGITLEPTAEDVVTLSIWLPFRAELH